MVGWLLLQTFLLTIERHLFDFIRRFVCNIMTDKGEEASSWPSSVDIVETEKRILLFLDLPGMSTSSFQVQYAANPPGGEPGGTLVVTGERSRPSLDSAYRVLAGGRFAGAFVRQVVVPVKVEPSSLKASYRDGVLLVRINKAASGPKPLLVLSFGGTGAPATPDRQASQPAPLTPTPSAVAYEQPAMYTP